MGLGIKQIQQGSEICREFAASIRRNPLKEGVTRIVTVARDGVTKSMGKSSELSFVEVKKPDGFHKLLLKNYDEGYTVKSVQYPDGSWAETTYSGVIPYRTNGEFVLLKDGGETVRIGYGAKGDFKPSKMKEKFLASLKKLGNPNAEVDLKDAFENASKSKVKKFFDGISYKIGKFVERFNKTNRALRKAATEFEKNN